MFHVVLPGAARPTRKPILTPMYLNQWDTHFAELLRAGKMEHASAALAVLAAKRATRSRRAIEAAVRSAHQSGGPIASDARGQREEERIQGAQFARERQLKDLPAPEHTAAGSAEEPAASGNQVRRAASRGGARKTV